MQKRILPVFLSLILVVCMGSVAVQARAQKVTPSLTFSGTTAQCSVVITSRGEKNSGHYGTVAGKQTVAILV